MIKICTVYFEVYIPDYVSKLYRSLKRNTIAFEFICLSDNHNVEDVVTDIINIVI